MVCDKVPHSNKIIKVGSFDYDLKCIKRKGHKDRCEMVIHISWWGKKE